MLTGATEVVRAETSEGPVELAAGPAALSWLRQHLPVSPGAGQ